MHDEETTEDVRAPKYEVQLEAIAREPCRKPMETGPVAYFSATVGGFRIDGFQLFRTDRGGLVVLPPGFVGGRTRGDRTVTIVDPALQSALLTAARTSYAAVFGAPEDVRFIPHSERNT